MAYDFQLELKLNFLKNLIQETSITFDRAISVISEEELGYRSKARLGLKWVAKKEKVVIGFRERGSSYITDSSTCLVLDERLQIIVFKLPRLIEQTSLKNMVPQVEVVTDEQIVAIILRHLKPLTSDDFSKLRLFSREFKVDIYLQSGGPDTISKIGNVTELYYEVAGCKLKFSPSSFIQVNRKINNRLVNIVIEEMNLNSEDRVVDFFCGLGNFSIPLAKHVKKVLGYRFDSDMIKLANENAKNNKCKNASFVKTDLYKLDLGLDSIWLSDYNKVILDPPRSGAALLISQLNLKTINSLAYVYCNASTLMKDAEILIDKHSFKISYVILFEIFPQTIHFETIMVFKK